ncbi:VOC family protein [bacterium]|jgi:predicted enzyme related to lactoylglutathione lyase|nr:VOC family protein [bacterium]
MARVTGIGGVFFKAKDPQKLNRWYEENLGIKLESWGGSILQWTEDSAPDKGITVWNLAKSDSDWFAPSNSSFMINYRVDDLDELIKQLKKSNVEIFQGPEQHENGKFAWVIDPEGNKVELWQPELMN